MYLPEGEENDKLYTQELADGFVRLQSVLEAAVKACEHDKGVADGHIHQEGDVQVAVARAKV